MGSPDPLSAAAAAEELKGTFVCDLSGKKKTAAKRKAAPKKKTAAKKKSPSRSRSSSPAAKKTKKATKTTAAKAAAAKSTNTWSLALKAVPVKGTECYVPAKGTARYAAVKAKQAQLEKGKK